MIIDQAKAIELLRYGQSIAVSTDTVYGIAADMSNERAILQLYNLKKRQLKKPLVIQLAAPSDLASYLAFVPFDLEKMIQRFWPGALTLVLPVKEKKVPSLIRSHLPTAAFRIANNNSLRSLIKEFGPLAVTSANYSGQKELLTVAEVEEVFGKDFPVLEGGHEKSSGIASTVLAYVDSSWVILRKGEIALKDLRAVVGYNPPVVKDVDFENKNYTICPQLHCMECPYDGSIKVVVGFVGREYLGAERVIYLKEPQSTKEVKSSILEIMSVIQNESTPHVWVDMNFPKVGAMKELATILKRSYEIDS